MKKLMLASAVIVLTWSSAWPGVVIEMSVADAGEEAKDTIYAQGEMLRMDPHASTGAGNQSIIFRDDTLFAVNHDEKLVRKIDRKTVEEIARQMEEMQKQLANLPPQQREMMEKMMQGKMPGMAGMGGEAPPRRIDVGGVEKVGKFSCTVNTVYAGDEKVREICTSEKIPEVEEAMEAFQAMARFTQSMLESFRQGPMAGMFETPFNEMDEVGGFPVRVRTFSGGRRTSESTLESVTERDIEAEVFAPPKGYKVKNLADEMKGGR